MKYIPPSPDGTVKVFEAKALSVSMVSVSNVTCVLELLPMD